MGNQRMKVMIATTDIDEDKLKEKGISIEHPGEVSFCFNPEIVRIEKTTNPKDTLFITKITMTADGTTYTDIRESLSGKVSMDISAYTKLFFDRELLGTTPEQSTTAKQVKVNIYYLTKDEYEKEEKFNETTDKVHEFETHCIWGALEIGETFNQSRTLTWFKNFPFTLSLYHPKSVAARVRYDKRVYTNYNRPAQLKPGILNLEPGKMFAAATNFAVLRLDYGDAPMSVFSRQFDYTFHPVGDGSLILRLNVDTCKQGTYLRWIDRHGFYQYYLFKEGSTEVKTTNQGIRWQDPYKAFGRYYNGVQRVQGKSAQRSCRICAPLVDRETFEMLKGVLYSPVVDLFYGYDGATPVFVPVEVREGSSTFTGESYKDFELEISLPETITQQL